MRKELYFMITYNKFIGKLFRYNGIIMFVRNYFPDRDYNFIELFNH
jgi:uncharacterized membrane protein